MESHKLNASLIGFVGSLATDLALYAKISHSR